MARPGRPPGLPKVPGSGRKKGSLDKSARLLITETMAGDILKVYKRLGPDWLFEVAKTRPDLFINQCLSRLLPPAFKDGADVELYQQVNIGDMSNMEAARRVAFALAAATYPDPSLAPPEDAVEPMTPQKACDWRDPTPPEPVDMSSPYDVDRAKWTESLSLPPDQKLVQNTKTESLATYAGSSAEQGGAVHRSNHAPDPRAAARDRMLARRRRDLL